MPGKLFSHHPILSKPIIGGKFVAANQQNPDKPRSPDNPKIPDNPKLPDNPKFPDNPKIPGNPKIPKQKTPPAANGARGYQIQRL